MKRISKALINSRIATIFRHYPVTRTKSFTRHLGPHKLHTKSQISLDEISSKCSSDKEKLNQINDVKKNLSDKYNVTFDVSPTKSENDSKDYLVMKLTNGLTALLVSDINDNPRRIRSCVSGVLKGGTEMRSSQNDFKLKERLAACSLTVGAGSFNDPEEIQGLAHLLEHMLFMGNKKFPDENAFNSFITSRGGSSNAVTDCETTTFYFDCPESHLEEIMDRFANFFVEPLFNPDSIIRERQSIESEFKMYSTNDILRLLQIIANTAQMSNPVHKFMWGNLITLKENVKDEVLLNTLKEFWMKQYSAHRMTLAVQARLPLENLGNLVASHFSSIPSNFASKDLFPYSDPPFRMELFHKMYTIKPVTDINMLRLTWALPPVHHLYKSKPTFYLSFVIGHEGKGSLMAYLKKQLWALNLVAGNGSDGLENNTTYSLFSITILLTNSGVMNLDKVLHSVFMYIKMLQINKPGEAIHKEMQFIAEKNFKFSPEMPSFDNVQFLSQCMQIYPPTDYMIGSQLLIDYDPDKIVNFLNYLTPDKVNIVLASKQAASKVPLDHTEKWFKAQYNMADIPANWIKDWVTSELDPNFFLPLPNQFIPKDFTILPSDNVTGQYPEKIRHDNYIEIWYKQDKKYLLPFAYINAYLISPYTILTPQNFVMCDLFVSLFSTVYEEEIYPASIAGLIHSLSIGDYGFLMSITGYNEKIQLFLETILNYITSLKQNVTEGIFDAVKEEQRKSYYSSLLNPTVMAKEMRLSVLCVPYCTTITKLDAISMIDLKKFQEFCDNFFQNMYIKCLIQGNVSKDQAIDMTNKLIEKLNYKPLFTGCCPEIRVRKIPKGEKIIRVKALNKDDVNSHITNYYQCGISNKVTEACIVEMLMLAMSEPLFDMLRTKEQLGYFVNNDIKYTYGVLGFSIAIKFQSDKFKAQHVESRITAFLKKMKTDFGNMKTEEFLRLKQSVIVLKNQEDTQLGDEVDRHWSEIESNEYAFDRLKQELEFIENVQMQDVHNYFLNILDNESKNSRCLRKISIQVDSNKSNVVKKEIDADSDNSLTHKIELLVPDKEGNGTKNLFVNNIENFRKSLYIYPALQIEI